MNWVFGEIYNPSNVLFPQIIIVEVFLPVSLRTNDEILHSKYYLSEQQDFKKIS